MAASTKKETAKLMNYANKMCTFLAAYFKAYGLDVEFRTIWTAKEAEQIDCRLNQKIAMGFAITVPMENSDDIVGLLPVRRDELQIMPATELAYFASMVIKGIIEDSMFTAVAAEQKKEGLGGTRYLDNILGRH